MVYSRLVGDIILLKLGTFGKRSDNFSTEFKVKFQACDK